MGAQSVFSSHTFYVLAILAGAACSVVNAGEEPVEPGSSSSSTTTSASSGTGGGGGIPEDCGDGDIQDPEECDDEGESATCDADCTIAECLDGTLNQTAGEECDDGGESANCDADCTARACGDNVTNGTAGEECDDGNVLNGDGCTGDCLNEGPCYEPFPLEDLFVDNGGMMVADLEWATSGEGLVAPFDCDGQPDLGAGPDRVFLLVLGAAANLNILVAGQGWDPILRLLTISCDPTTGVPEGGNADGCSDVGDVGAQEHLSYQGIAAGTYYIVVDGSTADSAGPFALHVEYF